MEDRQLYQRGSTTVPVVAMIFAVASIALAGWLFVTTKHKVDKRANANVNTNQAVACTAEAKLCPDGSSVGRTGPNCEFAACPTVNANTNAAVNTNTSVNTNTAVTFVAPKDWKTYANTDLGISFKYPPTFADFKANTDDVGYRGTSVASANTTKTGDSGVISLSFQSTAYNPSLIEGVYGLVDAENITAVAVGSHDGSMYLDGDAGCGGQNVLTNLTSAKTLWISFGDCVDDVGVNTNATATPLYNQKDLIKNILATFTFTN